MQPKNSRMNFESRRLGKGCPSHVQVQGRWYSGSAHARTMLFGVWRKLAQKKDLKAIDYGRSRGHERLHEKYHVEEDGFLEARGRSGRRTRHYHFHFRLVEGDSQPW